MIRSKTNKKKPSHNNTTTNIKAPIALLAVPPNFKKKNNSNITSTLPENRKNGAFFYESINRLYQNLREKSMKNQHYRTILHINIDLNIHENISKLNLII